MENDRAKAFAKRGKKDRCTGYHVTAVTGKHSVTMVEMRLSSFSACALAADGSKSTAMEFVRAEGNRIKGSAMLVSTPYMDNASLLVRP